MKSKPQSRCCVTSVVPLLLLCLALPLAANSQVVAGVMPKVSAEDLNERAVNLPAQLPADKTLVLMAFTQDQQAEVDTWVSDMGLSTSDLAWIETPVIDPSNAFVRAMINGGMRRGIPDTRIRERIVTLYTDGAALRRVMGLLSDGKTMVALVLDRSGKVLAQAQGRHSAEKAQQLLATLQAK